MNVEIGTPYWCYSTMAYSGHHTNVYHQEQIWIIPTRYY